MTSEMDLNALGNEAFTAALAAACENRAARFGFHACAKTELLFACPFRWLVSAFHKPVKVSRVFAPSTPGRNGKGPKRIPGNVGKSSGRMRFFK